MQHAQSLVMPSVWWFQPSEKYEFVSWDDEIPNLWKSKIHVPNHQPVMSCLFLSPPPILLQKATLPTPLPTPPQVEGGLCRLHGQFEVRPIICTSEPSQSTIFHGAMVTGNQAFLITIFRGANSVVSLLFISFSPFLEVEKEELSPNGRILIGFCDIS